MIGVADCYIRSIHPKIQQSTNPCTYKSLSSELLNCKTTDDTPEKYCRTKWGFRSTGGQIPRFPIDFAGHRYNSSAACDNKL